MKTPLTQTNPLWLPLSLVGVPTFHEHFLQRKLRIYLVLRMFPACLSKHEGRARRTIVVIIYH
jgi:hypothetical protein